MVDVALSRMSGEDPNVSDVVVADSCDDANLASDDGRAATLVFVENAEIKAGDEDRNRTLDLESITSIIANTWIVP